MIDVAGGRRGSDNRYTTTMKALGRPLTLRWDRRTDGQAAGAPPSRVPRAAAAAVVVEVLPAGQSASPSPDTYLMTRERRRRRLRTTADAFSVVTILQSVLYAASLTRIAARPPASQPANSVCRTVYTAAILCSVLQSSRTLFCAPFSILRGKVR